MRPRTVEAILIVGAHVPLVALFFVNLWRYRPHYEFFPVLLPAIGYLFWRRWPDGETSSSALTRLLAGFMLAAGFGLLAVSVVLFSPWIADSDGNSFVEVTLDKPTGEAALLHFSVFDSTGNTLAPKHRPLIGPVGVPS